MGSTVSVNNTILGRSVVGKCYQVMVPMYIDNVYENTLSHDFYLNTDEQAPTPKRSGEFVVKIPEGAVFRVTDVYRKVGIDSGTNLVIYGKFLDDIIFRKSDLKAFDSPSAVMGEILLVKDRTIQISPFRVFEQGYPVNTDHPLQIYGGVIKDLNYRIPRDNLQKLLDYNKNEI